MKRSKPNKIRRRLWLLMLFTLISGTLLLGRLFQIQVLLHSHYREIASKQHLNRVKLELPRGRIFDRRGDILSLNIPRSYSFGVHPREVNNRTELAYSLAKSTGRGREYYLQRMDSQSNFVWLARQLNLKRARPLMKIPGLVKRCETRRFYPFGSHTPKAVGFTDPDCQGIAGLEKVYDPHLTSVPGWETVLADAMGEQLENPVYSRVEPIPGADLALTFDNVIQELVCRELKSAVEQSEAKGGMALVMLPRTGEILALASMPDFDPNYSGSCCPKARRERNVVDIFEPGSTFKIVPMLAALNKGIPLSKKIFCENGGYRVGSHTIKDVHRFGNLSFDEVIIHSSNIGIAKVVKWMGAEELYRTARDLGFGTFTGIEIPGEARGILPNPNEWDRYMLATIGIGQGVSVTALQLACAYGAVANGGALMKPRIVRALIKPNGETEHFKPIQIRRVAKRKIAGKITDVLVNAVEKGTGKAARISGLKIAGKTGTAQKPLLHERGYSADKYIASFIGYTVDEPRILCLVLIDEPRGQHYGGVVAAPVFRRIMEKAVPIVIAEQNEYVGPVRDESFAAKTICTAPDLINLSHDEALSLLEKENIFCKVVGSGLKVTGQSPHPGEVVAAGDTMIIFTKLPRKRPNPEGIAARRAAMELISAGFKVKIVGSGIVRSAEFEGNRCTLFCKSNSKGTKGT